MTMRSALRGILLGAFGLVGVCALAGAQVVPALDSIKSQEELTRAIQSLDTQLFDAYNNCNIDKLGAMVADDLEFYHDKTGLAVGEEKLYGEHSEQYLREGEAGAGGGVAGGLSAAWIWGGGDGDASVLSSGDAGP
jgi:hypothetical protein